MKYTKHIQKDDGSYESITESKSPEWFEFCFIYLSILVLLLIVIGSVNSKRIGALEDKLENLPAQQDNGRTLPPYPPADFQRGMVGKR